MLRILMLQSQVGHIFKYSLIHVWRGSSTFDLTLPSGQNPKVLLKTISNYISHFEAAVAQQVG